MIAVSQSRVTRLRVASSTVNASSSQWSAKAYCRGMVARATKVSKTSRSASQAALP
jgi:transposase